jgi:hypothetical protein
MEHEIFGIAFNHETQKVGDLFDGLRDNEEEVVYESKKTYKHREEGLNFDYKYVIKAENLEYFTGDSADKDMWSVELMLVPTIDSILPKHRDSLIAQCGEGYEPNLCDLVDEGSYVQIGYERVYVDPDAGCDAVMGKKYDEIATVTEHVDSMRGFYLDKPYNMIGSTGWDIVNNLVGDGKSFIDAALDRWKESKK